jgi:hypothetical protein
MFEKFEQSYEFKLELLNESKRGLFESKLARC